MTETSTRIDQMIRMMKAGTCAALLFGVVACAADRETFEEGATFETPPAVEQAPATPIPPQPLPGSGPPLDTGATPTDTIVSPLAP